MGEILDWSSMRTMSERLLKERTGEDLAAWNARVQAIQSGGRSEFANVADAARSAGLRSIPSGYGNLWLPGLSDHASG